MTKQLLTALIVDDEPLARSDLKAILASFDGIEIAGEADSVESARQMIRKIHPDIIFLDIQMPGESGFDLLPDCGLDTRVIFVTAFNEFAIRAFEVNALDYLLKPVNEERLALTIRRLEAGVEEESREMPPLSRDDTMFVRLSDNFQFIRLSNIIKIEAADDYSVVFLLNGESHLTLKPMKEWEARLPANTFTRIHRSTIINMDQVARLEPWFNQSYKVYLNGLREPVTLSRRFFQEIRRRHG